MIGFALQSGCPKSGKIFSALMLELSKLFQTLTFDTFDLTITLRVSGKIWDFGFEGVDAVKFIKKKMKVTCDVGVPEVDWKGLPNSDVRRRLRRRLDEAFRICFDACRLAPEFIDTLSQQVDVVLDEFSRS